MNITRTTLLSLLFIISRAPTSAPCAAAPRQAPAAGQGVPAVERDEGRRVRVRLERGGRVSLDNSTTGRIVATGWDRDYIEAVATSERGAEYVRATSEPGPTGQRVTLKADYLTQPWPSSIPPIPPLSAPAPTPAPKPAPTPALPKPEPAPGSAAGEGGGREHVRPPSPGWPEFGRLLGLKMVPDEVHLEVKLPRYAEIELVTVNRSEVEVTGVATAVAVSGKRSAIRLRGVGAAEVRNERGSVEVDGASGLVDVVTTGGPISIRNVSGDVRALSLSGRIEVRCVRGRVNAVSTEGQIVLADVGGDVDAATVNSDVTLDGLVREEGRYHLKSMSGAVEMGVRRSPPGFTALLSSYRGAVESDFKLNSREQPKGASGTRLLGRHGDGRAQITLDSFDGRVKLSRLRAARQEECR